MNGYEYCTTTMISMSSSTDLRVIAAVDPQRGVGQSDHRDAGAAREAGQELPPLVARGDVLGLVRVLCGHHIRLQTRVAHQLAQSGQSR